MWNEEYEDVDLHMSYPTVATNNFSGFTTPYSDSPSPATDGGTPAEGSGAQTNRNVLFWSDKYSSGAATTYDYAYSGSTNNTYRANLDVDDRDGRGPETMTMRALPFDTSSTPYSGNYLGGDDTGLPLLTAPADYTWHGAAEIYAHGYSAGTGVTSATISSAADDATGTNSDVVLYVFFRK
jgi:hypothetical protein